MDDLLYADIDGACDIAADDQIPEPDLRALKMLVRISFVHTAGDLTAWFFYEIPSGDAAGLAIGQFSLKRQACRFLHRLGLGVALVPEALQPVVQEYGIRGLRWNGTRVVANGH